ncbi:YggS family pyridoxal phosphate-dependent enzyme [Actinoallomurus iriomotensis]|uniref:Pyridoxal phosphate homeostasis protein n=1 Tax=Actinoallomurus iriomotensis TaxID=478107 RepID=A0A9W6R9Q8_9ACTN|nr:YggS family pyridoxal phosphate-dependent enzyme [Actinoallomurus iriomotensis]GLY71914.1 YggS family pyridoxal phosphate enzyme [Actinoallomurus iriomotensis]
MSRIEELAANLAAVRERITKACHAAGRAPDEITLVAVTKTFPASDVRLLAELGITDVAENRDQEAAAKVYDCRDLDLTWHFVGQLQTNKARSVVSYADVIHSVDRARLVNALSRAATDAGRSPRCLIQVSLDEAGTAEGGRGGVRPDGVLALAEALSAAEGLRLGGLMAVAPLGADPAPAFARLAEISDSLRAVYPDAKTVSAGMSGDLEHAIVSGATHVRIGTALLGGRRAIVR